MAFERKLTTASATHQKWQLAREYRRHATQAEAILWEQLRAGRLMGLKFRRQHVISGFIADFYCHALRLVIEVDGEIHAQQIDYDRERDAVFKQLGIHVVRVANEDVVNRQAQVMAKIEITAHHLKVPNSEPTDLPPLGQHKPDWR